MHITRQMLQGPPIELPPLFGGGRYDGGGQCGTILPAVCADVCKSLDAILKRAYHNQTVQGRAMQGASALQQEAKSYYKHGSGGSSTWTYHYALTGPP